MSDCVVIRGTKTGSRSEVLALEGAMPAVTLPVVLCAAYGADARLAAKLVLTTIAASLFTIPVIFILSGLL
jgi:predicted permease